MSSRCSAVGSALGSGPRGHGFESRHFDHFVGSLTGRNVKGTFGVPFFFCFFFALGANIPKNRRFYANGYESLLKINLLMVSL